MEHIVKYLIESSIILGILTIFYRLILHDERIFRFNRFYLLLSLCLASVVPLIHLSNPVRNESQMEGFSYLLGSVDVYSTQFQEIVIPKIAQVQLFNWMYAFGVALLLVRLFYGFVQLGGLSRKATWSKVKGYRVANLPGRFNPFSFFNIIFVNQSLYSDDDLDKIMDHEMAHIQFKHSLDVLVVECLLIIQWFNPFAWIIQRLLKELHEFQADKEVLKRGTSVGQYKMLLLFQASGARLLPVNNFNQSITKKRFNMMTNNSLKKYGVFKALMALMVVSTVTFFFACDNEYSEEDVNNSELKGTESSLNDEIAYNVVEKMPEYPGGDMELRKFIAQNVKYPTEAQELGIQGRVYVSFVVGMDGVVKDIKVVRGVHETIDNEAVRVIGLMPKWEPGMQRGEYVNVNFTVPINFVLEGEEGSSLLKSDSSKNPLVIMDGNEISYEELQKMDPKMISQIDILKDSAAVAIFGEKGTNGVIKVKTKFAGSEKNSVHVVAYKSKK